MQELNMDQLEKVSGGLKWWQIALISLVSPTAAAGAAVGGAVVKGVYKDNQTKYDISVET